MEVIVFFLAMVGVILFWRVLLVLAAIGFAWLFVKGVLSVYSPLPPPHDEWQWPWNLTHGHLEGDELFWTVVFGAITVLICWMVFWRYAKKIVRKLRRSSAPAGN
jgi:hypothetical protein